MITSFKATTARPFAASTAPTLSSKKPDNANQCCVCSFSFTPLFAKLSLCGKTSVTAQMSKNDDGLAHKDAGVDIDAGFELVHRITIMAPGIGGFGGLFPLGDSFLDAGTDGVETKLKLAFETGIHDTIAIDLIAMSVNDIVTSGAKALVFS